MDSSKRLEDLFVFYGAYHNNIVNKWVHILCVPLIAWSLMIGLGGIGEVVSIDMVHSLPSFYGWVPQCNIGFFLGLGYLMYYLTIEPVAAISYVPFVYLQYVSAGWVSSNVEAYKLFAAGVHLLSWVMQIVSHYVFEKRAPALLDSVHQAAVMAPLFVWMEVLFMFGYRRELVQSLQVRIDAEISKFREQQQLKGSSSKNK